MGEHDVNLDDGDPRPTADLLARVTAEGRRIRRRRRAGLLVAASVLGAAGAFGTPALDVGARGGQVAGAAGQTTGPAEIPGPHIAGLRSPRAAVNAYVAAKKAGDADALARLLEPGASIAAMKQEIERTRNHPVKVTAVEWFDTASSAYSTIRIQIDDGSTRRIDSVLVGPPAWRTPDDPMQGKMTLLDPNVPKLDSP